MISNQVTNLKGSSTARFLKLAKDREAEGHHIIHLEIGQPDFQPLSQIIDATVQAIHDGKTDYTVSSGIPELREAISQAYIEDFRIDIDPQTEIKITTGAKLGIFSVIFSILDEGDSLLVPEPYWVSYPDMTQLARGKFVSIPMKDDFRLNQNAILEAISGNNVKSILINSPNNPSGHVLSTEEIKFLKDLVVDNNLFIISDEIYNDYVYIDTSIKTLLTEFNDWRDNIIVINGFSKTFSMTGYRLGYTISNSSIASGILKILQASTSCPANFCQWAGIAALKEREKAREIINTIFPKRRQVLLEEIQKTDGISLTSIDGAFYGFLKYDFTNKPSEEVAEDLLRNANVCVIPGTAFGVSTEGYLRVTFSRSEEEIQEGFKRIRDYLRH
ncbi:MAG: pyridoxal phosphate-dependent aminotransferase [Candidatus Hermodarchaeota archaeon]